jgi:flagellar protein FliO/FliZ
MSTFIDVLGFILIFGSVLFLVYVTTKFVGGFTARTMKSNNMEVIETLKLGVDKQLFIVRAGEIYILMASSGKSLEYICELNLDEEALNSQNEKQTGTNEFTSVLEKYLSNLKPQEGMFKGKYYKRDDKNKKESNTDFANNIRKLQNLNNKFSAEDIGHDE